MVEIFKTDVQLPQQAEFLLGMLSENFPEFKMNFDLHDCDNILRVEGKIVVPEKIIEVLNYNCYNGEVLN